MRLWQKVFLCTFILFELLFNTSSFYLIEHNFNQNLEIEIDRGLSEQLVLSSQISTDWLYINNLNQQFKTLKNNADDFIKNNSQQYMRFFDSGKVSIEILDNKNKIVFSNFTVTVTGPRHELDIQNSINRKYIIRDNGKKSYLFAASRLKLGEGDFKLVYIRDITGVYSDKSAQIVNFVKINIIITIILAIGLYFLIWFLTCSVRMLTKSAQTIAAGDYSQRVKVLSQDEIGLLSENFNKMADAIEGKVDELEAAAKNRENFIYYLTHELKTPLTSIIGYADLLRTTKYNEDIFYKCLNYIYSEGKRLESLSFKLMDLILIGNKKTVVEIEDILPIFEETEQTLKPQLEKSNVELSLSVESVKLVIEKDLIKLLCTNLLDNAIKASKAGGRIYFRGYVPEEYHYVIEVEDEGIGISEEDIPKVFEPFFMADKARSRANNGAGLGLAICAEIVKLHEGRIEIKSRLNEGTIVRIIVPKIYN